jgi:hypothetical protein
VISWFIDNRPFAVTLIRLFLLLTKPLSKEVTDAINGIFKKRKSSKETAAEQRIRTEKELAIKKNAYQQLNAQLMFKEAIVNRTSRCRSYALLSYIYLTKRVV